jgi:flagellar biosynthesis/type III secretory pathway protein FliH
MRKAGGYVPLSSHLADFGEREGRSRAHPVADVLSAARAGERRASPLRAALQAADDGADRSMASAITAASGAAVGKGEDDSRTHSPPSAPAAEEEEAARLAAAREEGFREGLAEGRRHAEEECSARLEAMQTAHAEELAARERLWADQLARDLARRVDDGLSRVMRELETILAEMLAPVLATAVRERAVADFARVLAGLAAAEGEPSPALVLTVRGPRELLEALTARLPDIGLKTERDDTATDLEIRLRDTVVRTRLAEWRRRLEQALEPAQAPLAAAPEGTDDGDRTP